MAELEFILEAPERGRVVAFPSKSFVIGSDADCPICFKSQLVAPRHAEVVKDTRGQWWIRDLMGSGAVVVNGSPVLDERLASGDKLRIGDVVMTVQDSGVNAFARTRSGDNLPAVVPEGELQPDTVIDNRYRIIRRLATGGMGEVYQAVHVELGRALALKVMLPELSGDPDFVGRFKREAIASSRIGHQNIVDISDFGRTADGRFYFVMEYVEGKTLVKHRRAGPFPFQRVVHVGLQIARALGAAHAVNIIHRDLKPENVMLLQKPGQPDFVKVLDFGIAKVINSANTGGFTAIGSVVGTPQYMAPEQAGALPVDARSDIYSLGLILHELVRGQPTFTGDSAVELMSHQLATPPPPLTSPLGEVPGSLARIIGQMLEKNPDDRPASMDAVATALEAVASFPTPTSRTPPVRPSAEAKTVLMSAPTRLEPLSAVVPPSAPAPAATTRARSLTPPPPAAPPPREAPARPNTPRPQAAYEVTDELKAVRPSRLPMVLLGLLALVLALGVGVFVTRGGDTVAPVEPPPPVVTAPPEPSPPAAPAPVKLTLEATPEQVEVYDEDILLGATPLQLSRPQGTLASVRFEAKGYQPLVRKIRFESDTTLRVELQKEAPRSKPRPVRAPQPGDLMDLPD